MSMMRSKTMSEKSEPIIAGLVLLTLNRVQVFATGDHTARSYSSRVSDHRKQSRSKTVEIEIHQ